MKIIICGAGRVGRGIAERLTREKQHDIVIIDANEALVDEVSTDLDVRGVRGHAAHPDVLSQADAENCDMIIAVTYHDEINMVICQVASTLFSIPSKIARVRAGAYLEPRWKDLFARTGLPIDLIISPEKEVGQAIIQRLRTPGALMSASFARGKVQLLGLPIRKSSPLVDTLLDQVAGLFPDLDARIIGIGRGGDIEAPRSNDKLMPGDRVYLTVLNEHAARLGTIFDTDNRRVNHVTIVGAGNVGYYVAETLEQDRSKRVRVVERDARRAEAAAARLRRSVVIQGSGLDREILEEAGGENTDFLVATTEDDRTNLLVCNLAKSLGVGRTMSLVNDPQLAQLGADMRVDSIIDPRALTVSQVLMRMRRGRILSLLSLEDGQAEVVEGLVLETSPLVGKTLGYDDLPDGITAAVLLRGEDVLFPSADLRVQPDDRLTLLFHRDMTKQVERYFRVSPDSFL